MKHFITLILISFSQLNLFAQWEWQNPKPQSNDILDSYFIDEHNG